MKLGKTKIVAIISTVDECRSGLLGFFVLSEVPELGSWPQKVVNYLKSNFSSSSNIIFGQL